MKKTALTYGTYRPKEMDAIIEIYEDCGVEYQLVQNIHTHGANKPKNEKDTWCFYRLDSQVTPEEERRIRSKRDLLKKRYC